MQDRATINRMPRPHALLLFAVTCNFVGCNSDPEDLKPGPGRKPQASTTQSKAPVADKDLTNKQSHTRMVKVLRAIAQSTDQHNPYHALVDSQRFKEFQRQLGKDASELQHWEINIELGLSELKLGRIRSAIDHLNTAKGLVAAAKIDATRANFTKFKLGVAYMRWGETQNCCKLNNADSCIVPIQGGGIHTDLEGSTSAIGLFKEILATKPQAKYTPGQPNSRANSAANLDLHRSSRWLLNIAYMTIGGYPDQVPKEHLIPETVFQSSVEFPRFKNIAPGMKLSTFSLCGGAIADDFDNDGYLDVVASTWNNKGQIRFFRNNGDGTFAGRTGKSGLLGLYGGLNLLSADYNNDGNLDILVMRGAWLGASGRYPNSLLHNNGDGTFTDVTFKAGLAQPLCPTQTAGWADYDNDGHLDLYVGNEFTSEFQATSQLFHNNGDGTFTDVTLQAGVPNVGFAKGVSWGDYDGDRFMDLYISNYKGPNRLYRNNGDGTFTDVATKLGVEEPSESFPTWFWDFDNDGVLDLFVSSYAGRIGDMVAYQLGEPTQLETARLYRGDGQGGFKDVAKEVGLRAPMLPMGANFGDLNNDGYLDFYLGTGDPDFENLMPNQMYLNHNGQKFVDVTMAGGFAHLQKGHAVSFADLDNDGDADVFEQMGGAYYGDEYQDLLFENPGFGNHWVCIKLVGQTTNRAAIGARIHLRVTENGKARSIFRHVNSGGSFGCNPLRQTIGTGKSESIDVLEIYWPVTNRTQTFKDVRVDQFIRIVEDQDTIETVELKSFKLGR
ncbi:MAG: CRTAC1 family protein [Planctomycetota bacterium]|nr:CRTAC1 family protein [Planctomycetota bacterium]